MSRSSSYKPESGPYSAMDPHDDEPSDVAIRNFSRMEHGQHRRATPQWNSWRTPGSSQSSNPQQPITINLSFGGADPNAMQRNLLPSNSGNKNSSSAWIDEIEKLKTHEASQWNRRSRDSLKVNLLLQQQYPELAHLARHSKLSHDGARDGDEKATHHMPYKQETPPSTSSSFTHDVVWIYPPVASGFWKLVQNFDFKWYGSTMGTGIVSILLFTLSEIYTGGSSEALLHTLSVVFFIMNVVLFTFIAIMTCLRYLAYPRLFVAMISDPGQAMYLGTMPMGFATLITMTVNVAIPHLGAPGPWTTVAWVLWWIDVLISMACALAIPWLLQTLHHGITDLEKMTAGWLLPIVAPIVAAATGSAVASALADQGRVDDAMVTILTSYAILGTGLPAALAIIVIYFLRIATKKLPPTEHMVSTFLPLGPLGQGGFAFQQLGGQALRVFPLVGALPDVTTANGSSQLAAGQILYTLGFMAAIILWGFGLMWLFLAALSVTRQRVPFSLGWWAFTFPLGVFATSTLTMGRNLPSVTFQALGTIFAVAVMGFWVMVSGILLSRLITGKKYTIFKAPEVTGSHNQKPKVAMV